KLSPRNFVVAETKPKILQIDVTADFDVARLACKTFLSQWTNKQLPSGWEWGSKRVVQVLIGIHVTIHTRLLVHLLIGRE
ncbi:hypothetical protein EVAR_68372_1, partial [Eumeta japonica]